MNAVKIKPFAAVRPMIYCYSTPGVAYHEGWVKIGYTERDVEKRIREQAHTIDIRWKLNWQEFAQYKDSSGGWFTDHDFHNYLEIEKEVEREKSTEWFHVDAGIARNFFNDFADRKSGYDGGEKSEYQLRKEQKCAVKQTVEYFKRGGTEFLWNAKPRFGKTLTTYGLVRQMRFRKVLVVTNRPSIAHSWADDFNKFISWRGELCFVSETLIKKKGVKNREEYIHELDKPRDAKDKAPGFIEFESLQNLKGSCYFGGDYDKLKWLSELDFDLLVVDEAHEGVDTFRTDRAFDKIKRKHTLYLSGTPFKALAESRFSEGQIFNWTYADEQETKKKWKGESFNPYEELPRMAMFTYRLSDMICERLQRGAEISEGETVDYAFDLNEFFSTREDGKFNHEAEIKKFLRALATQEKYPFSTSVLRRELSHTLWLLDRVASAKALAKLLKEDSVFSEYEIVLAAGDGRTEDDVDTRTQKAYDKVKRAILDHPKTITLSVGQLTVGVTIPEWSGVLMLCNMKSPAAYMQAAFRAQNPCMFTRTGVDGKPEVLRKETAYVFDFDPARTLIIYDKFANNLNPDTAAGLGSSKDREAKIRKLLNFFPVLGEDDEGRMVELDAEKVLSIPRRIKCVEVVRRGFMSNFLFQNISNIFGAPAAVREIVEKLSPAHEEFGTKKKSEALDDIENVQLNPDGSVELPTEVIIGRTKEIFGPKIYEELNDQIKPSLDDLQCGECEAEEETNVLIETVKDAVTSRIIVPLVQEEGLSRLAGNRIERQVTREIKRTLDTVKDDFLQQQKTAQAELNRRRKEAESEEELNQAEKEFQDTIEEAQTKFKEGMQEAVQKIINEKPTEVVARIETRKKEEEKKAVEDSVRDHLRGFSRTIPSFLMAYGSTDLTLENFDRKIPDDVFLEVTGISEDDFRFLRDGGEYTDPETGEQKHFEGHLFDETVFNDSVQEFLKMKKELSNYFDESHTEDIFDYIPPQKTNQIFTPRRVVKQMIDALEEENPGCFDNPEHTFADLYMKSGMYIAEIVKRLFRSKKMKNLYPDDKKRIKHILQKQVYGMAPTRIIFLIATNYILGFDEEVKNETKNFVQADAAAAAKEGALEQLVEKYFG